MSDEDALSDALIPRLSRGVKLREDKVRGHWTLLGPERVLELDQIGVEILNRCDGMRTLGAVIKDLAEAFEANEEVVGPDVRAFLTDLRNRGFADLS